MSLRGSFRWLFAVSARSETVTLTDELDNAAIRYESANYAAVASGAGEGRESTFTADANERQIHWKSTARDPRLRKRLSPCLAVVVLIPKVKTGASNTYNKGNALDLIQPVVIAQDLAKAVERDATGPKGSPIAAVVRLITSGIR